MTPPADIAELMQRFLDDRDSLVDDEYARLVEAVRSSPELGARLRDQLIIDDTLSQHLAIDRRHFDAQVQQRIDDHLREEEELNRQTGELQSLALSHLENAATTAGAGWSALVPLAVALTLLITVGLGIGIWQKNRHEALLAQVEAVEGRVVVRRMNDHDQYAQDQLPLRHGDRLLVEDDAALTLRWSDGTRVQLQGGTVADLPATTAGKRMFIDTGAVAAIVARQPGGRPMVFATPHADAVVRGTELYLRVFPEETRLEVAEGKVELVEHRTSSAQLVAAGEAAVAAPGEKVVKRAIQWPSSREGLVYLFAGNQRPVLVRSKGILQPTSLTPLGAEAAFNAQGELELNGGLMIDRLAAGDIATELRASRAFTLEALLSAGTSSPGTLRTLLALESDQGVLFALSQQDDRLLLAVARHEPLSDLAAQSIDLGPLPAATELSRVVVTYAQGRFTAYLNDAPPRTVEWERPTDPWLASADATCLVVGGLTNRAASNPVAQPWRGRVAAVALYDRALAAAEIERSVRKASQ